jgi:hypothetical protein
MAGPGCRAIKGRLVLLLPWFAMVVRGRSAEGLALSGVSPANPSAAGLGGRDGDLNGEDRADRARCEGVATIHFS